MINKGWAAIGKRFGFHVDCIDGAFLHTEIACFTIFSDPAMWVFLGEGEILDIRIHCRQTNARSILACHQEPIFPGHAQTSINSHGDVVHIAAAGWPGMGVITAFSQPLSHFIDR